MSFTLQCSNGWPLVSSTPSSTSPCCSSPALLAEVDGSGSPFSPSPRNLARLPPIPPHLSSLLQLVPLSMPSTVGGLPPLLRPPWTSLLKWWTTSCFPLDISVFLDVAAPDVIIHGFFVSWLHPPSPPPSRLHRLLTPPTGPHRSQSSARPPLAKLPQPGSLAGGPHLPGSMDTLPDQRHLPPPRGHNFLPDPLPPQLHWHLQCRPRRYRHCRCHRRPNPAPSSSPTSPNCTPIYTTSLSYPSACSSQKTASASAVAAAAAGKRSSGMGSIRSMRVYD